MLILTDVIIADLIDWFSYTVSIRGTLQEVPFIASARYGWTINKFEWKFSSMPTNKSGEKIDNSPTQENENALTTREKTSPPTQSVRITAKTDVNARAMMKTQTPRKVPAIAELRELTENKEETPTSSKVETTQDTLRKKVSTIELTESSNDLLAQSGKRSSESSTVKVLILESEEPSLTSVNANSSVDTTSVVNKR